MNYKQFLSVSIVLILSACFSVRYDAKGGADINPAIQTVSVQYFNNRATRVNPSLSQNFTDKLKEYLESNSKMRVVNTLGDIDFSGEITSYDFKPQAISAGDIAAKTRFTVTIRVKYSNSVEPEKSFDTSFSRYRDFESTQSFNDVEASLLEEIIEELIEQIFNKAFVNW